MKNLTVVLQILAALVVLVGGAVIVKHYRQSHRPRSIAYAPLTAGDELDMATVACGRATDAGENNSITCSVCPTGSDFADGGSMPGQTGWTMDGTLAGHFTAAGADEALMHASGCESHARSYGGDFIMRRSEGVWSVIRYAPGAIANSKCQKLKWQQDRDAVICETTDLNQGIASDAVQLLLFDATAPSPPDDFANATFVSLTDETGNCGSQQPHNGAERLMQFGKIDAANIKTMPDGSPDLEIEATIERARSVPTTAGVCPTGHRRSYHIAYHNMGDHFEAGDGSKEFAMQLRDDCCDITLNKSVRPGKY